MRGYWPSSIAHWDYTTYVPTGHRCALCSGRIKRDQVGKRGRSWEDFKAGRKDAPPLYRHATCP